MKYIYVYNVVIISFYISIINFILILLGISLKLVSCVCFCLWLSIFMKCVNRFNKIVCVIVFLKGFFGLWVFCFFIYYGVK